MNVGELIEKLQRFHPDVTAVSVCEHDSYTGHTLSSVGLSETGLVTITPRPQVEHSVSLYREIG